MNISDHKQIVLTKEEAEAIRKDFKKSINECVKHSVENMKNDIAIIDNILPVLQDDNVSFDELIIPLHNLFCIVPEEQHRFLKDIKDLFLLMPNSIQKDKDFKYVRNRLIGMTKEMVDSKYQCTDLSEYWTSYRSFVYKYGHIEGKRQIKIQQYMRKTMLQVCVNTVAKRTKGIISATKFGEQYGDKLENTADDNRDKRV